MPVLYFTWPQILGSSVGFEPKHFWPTVQSANHYATRAVQKHFLLSVQIKQGLSPCMADVPLPPPCTYIIHAVPCPPPFNGQKPTSVVIHVVQICYTSALNSLKWHKWSDNDWLWSLLDIVIWFDFSSLLLMYVWERRACLYACKCVHVHACVMYFCPVLLELSMWQH